MLFTSLVFLGFLGIVVTLYWALPWRWAQNAFLLTASLLFYAFGEPRFVALILVCAATGYLGGIAIERHRERGRMIVTIGAGVALGILFTFKYFDFFIGGLSALGASVGLEFHPLTLRLLLPIGISFFTFQTVGYMVDVQRGDCRAERNPIDFFLFVTFFPQLVAGPIERANNLLAQMKQQRRLSGEDLRWGSQTMLQGYVKKVVVADNLAPIVDQLFDGQALSGPLVAVACLAFAFQIYCDFSGYTDIARGVARCLGFRLTENFRRPYLATSPSEFWHRWHITLSTWFRDYVYIPLGGGRQGPARSHINLLLTFLVSGLWHGASINFVLWGAFHGAIVALHKILAPTAWLTRLREERTQPVLAWGVTFVMVLYGWMLFRVSDLAAIRGYSLALVSDPAHLDLALLIGLRILPYIAIAVAVDWLEGRLEHAEIALGRFSWMPRPALVSMLLVLVVLGADGGSAFIYFKF